jgi:gamma-tubulin complex component 3
MYRHSLTAVLESAIRSSNARNDPSDIRRRLDARILEYSRGEVGWDVFALEYKVDAPIDTIIDPESMVLYMKIFKHLWNLKRVEAALSRGWMRVAGGARTYLRFSGMSCLTVPQPAKRAVGPFKRTSVALAFCSLNNV